MDCIFCKIASGEIPASVLHRDDDVIAIADLHPQAPTHLLVMPVKHYRDVTAIAQTHDDALMGKLFTVASRLGGEGNPDGFRLVANTGADGGQTVDHVHVHVLGGRSMQWPPG